MKKLQSSNDETKFALIDDDVFEIIKDMNLKFCINNYGYFISTTKIKLPEIAKKKCLYLHRFVWIIKTKTEPTSSIDHADINPLNNQFENLRLASRREQQHNKGKRKDNTSGYIGVNHHHKVNKHYKNGYIDYWKTSIRKPDGHREAKYFPYTPEGKIEAGKWYDDHARKYFGDFAGQLNFPTPSDKQ